MLGFKFEVDVPTCSNFIDSTVFFLDDTQYFRNNLTDFTSNAWEAPFLNFTRMIGGNFSHIFEDAYVCQQDALAFYEEKYAGFDGDIGAFLLGFTFSLMGNSLKFK